MRCGGSICNIVFAVEVDLACIKLEAVDAVFCLQTVQLCGKPFHSAGVDQIELCGVAVPPAAQRGRTAAIGITEQIALITQIAVFSAVSRNKRAYPNHDLKAHCMQLIDHCARIGECCAVEIPSAVIVIPVIIDHNDSGRKPIVEDAVCVLQYVSLILIIDQFDPCIILRLLKEILCGKLAVCGEVRLACREERAAQIAKALA